MWSLLIIGRAFPKTVLFVGFTPSSTSSLEIRVYIFVVYITVYRGLFLSQWAAQSQNCQSFIFQIEILYIVTTLRIPKDPPMEGLEPV